jgi:DNA-binding transcriptional LysR family regulator
VISFSLDVRMHLLATGRYLTMLGGMVLHYNAERWSLRRLPIDLGIPEMPMAVFTLKNRTLSPVVQLFVENVRALAKWA